MHRPGSAYAAIMVTTGPGVRMQDNCTHGRAGLPGASLLPPRRGCGWSGSGDTLTGYDSVDGTYWTRVGAASLAGLPSVMQAGVFDYVSLSGTRPCGA